MRQCCFKIFSKIWCSAFFNLAVLYLWPKSFTKGFVRSFIFIKNSDLQCYLMERYFSEIYFSQNFILQFWLLFSKGQICNISLAKAFRIWLIAKISSTLFFQTSQSQKLITQSLLFINISNCLLVDIFLFLNDLWRTGGIFGKSNNGRIFRF